MDMESSKVQEVEKLDTDEASPEPMKPEESKEKQCVSCLDMILKVLAKNSLRKINLFMSDVLIASCCQETHQRFKEEYLGELHGFFLSKLSLTRPLEENGVSEVVVTVLELLPRWNSGFKLYELVKKNCDRCETDTEHPPELSHGYGILIIADSLRETKSEFEHFSFEDVLKFIMINLKMHCEKEGCEKQSYVQRAIKKLPSVFTIAFEWENNETEEEIYETVSVLTTEIDIAVIYHSEDDCPHTKYHLVSMVCLHGDQYNCLAYENERWVRYFGSEEEVIGEWDRVLSTFTELNMRPEILFFENVMQRDKIVKAQRHNKSVLERKLAEQWCHLL